MNENLKDLGKISLYLVLLALLVLIVGWVSFRLIGGSAGWIIGLIAYGVILNIVGLKLSSLAKPKGK
jgi:uncharacterized membrane protein AbrB (regulator of aidB expression)